MCVRNRKLTTLLCCVAPLLFVCPIELNHVLVAKQIGERAIGQFDGLCHLALTRESA